MGYAFELEQGSEGLTPSFHAVDITSPNPLTEREGQVLLLSGQGLSGKEIAAALGIKLKTVSNLLSRGVARLPDPKIEGVEIHGRVIPGLIAGLQLGIVDPREVLPKNYDTAKRGKLSNRLHDVILLQFVGLSHQQIAEKLGISQNTVNNEIIDAYKILGVSNEFEAFGVVLNAVLSNVDLREAHGERFDQYDPTPYLRRPEISQPHKKIASRRRGRPRKNPEASIEKSDLIIAHSPEDFEQALEYFMVGGSIVVEVPIKDRRDLSFDMVTDIKIIGASSTKEIRMMYGSQYRDIQWMEALNKESVLTRRGDLGLVRDYKIDGGGSLSRQDKIILNCLIKQLSVTSPTIHIPDRLLGTIAA